MRINKKNNLTAILTSLTELHSEILQREVMDIQENFQDCQQAAILIGEIIEQEAPDEGPAVSLLEKYCEELYYLSQKEIVSQEVIERLNSILSEVKDRIEKIQTTYQVVFFPYKAEMWDSMESIWLACKEDRRCEAVVVPIPYYRYDADKKETRCFYDGDKFPEYVPTVSYLEYSLPDELPEAAYIHNPYDRSNLVTSVHPAFYSDELKKYVQKLVYVPYYVTRGSISYQQSMMPAYFHMDYMVVQSEHFIKRNKDMFYFHKAIPLGSPKLDKVIRLCKEKKERQDQFPYPAGWKEVLKDKKSLMLNTSLSCFLIHGEIYLQKLFYLFRRVQSEKKVVIIWRPHPLLEATIHSLRKDLLPKYRELLTYFEEEKIGILDTTPDISTTVAIADGYIGEEDSSVVCLFGAVGKPQFILSNYIYEETDPQWKRRMRIQDMVLVDGKYYLISSQYQGLFSMEGDWNQIQYVERVEEQPKWLGGCTFLAASEESVFLSPQYVFEAAEYCTKNREFRRFAPSGYYLEEKQFMYCRQVVTYKDKVFYLPENSGAIWEYNRNTTEWIKHWECIEELKKGIEKEKYQSVPDTIDYVQWDNCILVVAGYTDRVLRFHMENADYEIFDIGGSKKRNSTKESTVEGYSMEENSTKENTVEGYSAITGSAGIFWLAKIESGNIIKWNVRTGEILEWEMPADCEPFVRYNGSKYVHYKLLEMGEWIVSVPAYADWMVKIHKLTGEMKLCGDELWKDVGKASNDYHPKFYMACGFAKKIDDSTIWLHRNRDDVLIEFNLEKENYQIYDPLMTEESLKRFMQGEDGFERFNRDWYAFARRESRLFSFEDFMEEFTEDRLEEVRVRQLEELSGFAANLDGSCGEKVHEFMMKVLQNSF